MPELVCAGRRPTGRLAGLLAVLALAVLIPGSARAASVAEEMAVARDFFLIADYASALDKVSALLRSGTAGPEERQEALELEARCHVALGSRMKAVDSFCSALQRDPAWRPDLAGFTEAERDAFAKAFDLCGPLGAPMPSWEPIGDLDPQAVSPPGAPPAESGGLVVSGKSDRPWYRSPWVLGGVGGVIAGVALLTFSSEDSPPPAPLPDFPAPPE